MNRLRTFFSRLRAPLIREHQERDLALELDVHVQMLTDDNIRAGIPPEDARRQAQITLGGMESVKENCRDRWSIPLLESLLQDLRYAARGLLRSPGFALTILLILSLGIGANTAVFSVVNTVLLKPLNYNDPDRIVTLASQFKSEKKQFGPLFKQISVADFDDWHAQASAFEALGYYQTYRASVMAGSEPEYRRVTAVSPEFFTVFRLKPEIGRLPDSSEQGSGGGYFAVISHAYWQDRFGGDPRVIGQAVRAFGIMAPIAGVAPRRFGFPDDTDIWIPAVRRKLTESRSGLNYLAIGRLKGGLGLGTARAQMSLIAARLEKQYPETNAGRSVSVNRLQDDMVGNVRLTLYLLLAAVAMVLIIACSNTAGLLLAEAAGRVREIAVRVALGATRARITRQMTTESLLLSLLGGTAGLLLAWWGSRILLAFAPTDVAVTSKGAAAGGVDGWVLLFTSGVSLIAGLLFGLAPAFHSSAVDLNSTLKQGAGRSVVGGGSAYTRKILVVAQMALSLVLLAGAGVFIKSFIALQNVTLGFQPRNVLVMRTTVPEVGLEGTRRANDFFKGLLTEISATPGVLAAGATMGPPGRVDSQTGFWIDHMPEHPSSSGAPAAVLSVVAPGTFAALGTPLLRGRDFRDSDTFGAPLTAVINEALARTAFEGQDPIGRTIFCPFDSLDPAPLKIIGIAGDVRQHGPAREPMPECFLPYQQHQYNGTTLNVVVHTSVDPISLTDVIRRMVRQRSPVVAVEFTTMDALLDEGMKEWKFRMLLLGIFAVLAVGLTVTGLYGVISQAVSHRSGEFGLRVALGAAPYDILRLVLRQGLAMIAIGVAVGLTGAVATSRPLSGMLFEVKAIDASTYIVVTILLVASALGTTYIPARRAVKVDPLIALRQE
jgi:putative ABC transport system permease protein